MPYNAFIFLMYALSESNFLFSVAFSRVKLYHDIWWYHISSKLCRLG